MARSFVPLAVVGLLIGAVVPGNAQTTDPAALRAAIAKVGGRVIIALKPGTGTFLRARGTPAVSAAKMDVIEQRMMKQYRLRVQSRAEIAAALFATIADSDVVRILADTNVDYIEPDQLSMPAVKPGWYGNGTAKKLDDIIPWGVADVKAPAAWAAGLTGAGVKVGIIDGGIDYANSQLNVVGGYNFPTSDPTPAGYMDDIGACDGHGTHIAGTVGARQDGQSVVGVAPGVQLYALKVLQDVGGSCLSFLSYQIAAVNYAATNGIRVVNISIGNSGYSPSYQTAITNAIAAGVTVVASAGNNGGGSIVYPGAYAGVIAVGALDQGDTPAGYESVGPGMFIAAPGTNVQSPPYPWRAGVEVGDFDGRSPRRWCGRLDAAGQPDVDTGTGRCGDQGERRGHLRARFRQQYGLGSGAGANERRYADAVVAQRCESGSAQHVGPAGERGHFDQASVTIAGTGASSTSWSASRRSTWLALTTASGTGSGVVTWTRNAGGLLPGTYVDTVTIAAAGVELPGPCI